jgi:hypothetical protein
VVEGTTFEVPADAHGGRIALRAIPVDAVRAEVDPSDMSAPEKELDVDLTQPDVLSLRWHIGRTVINELTFTQGPGPALVQKLGEEWRASGTHRDLHDRKVDQAIVRVLPTVSFADLFPGIESILAKTRSMYLGGEVTQVPVFAVSVQPPIPPVVVTLPFHQPPSGPLPPIALDALQVNGRLHPEIVRRVLMQRLGFMRRCYAAGLARRPALAGRLAMRFVIGNDGAVSVVRNAGSDLADAATVDCVARVLQGTAFPRPEGGIVTVVAPFRLSPK